MTYYISPYRRIAGLREAMNRLIDDSVTEAAQSEREMLLAVDLQAEEESYTITALVPGLEAEDVSIEVINNTITLRGEFKSNAREDARYLTCELPTGKFARVITLPTALEAAKAEAAIKNGVLTLRVPKAEAHRPKTIKVAAV